MLRQKQWCILFSTLQEDDRGWFARDHEICQELPDFCFAGYDSFQFVLSYAIICGLSWIGAGILSYRVSKNLTKNAAQLPFLLYTVSFIIFVGLFGVVMFRVNGRDYIYPRKSGNEFKAYSICSFLTILPCIVITYLPVFFMDSKSKNSIPYKNVNDQDNKGTGL